MNSLRSRGTEARRAACAALAAAARDLFDMGRNDLALPVAKMALEEDPSFGNAHSTMAGILDTFGQFEEALQHWGEAARLTSGSAQQQLNHALAVLAACRTRDFRSITTAVRLRRRGHQTAGGAPITS